MMAAVKRGVLEGLFSPDFFFLGGGGVIFSKAGHSFKMVFGFEIACQPGFRPGSWLCRERQWTDNLFECALNGIATLVV